VEAILWRRHRNVRRLQRVTQAKTTEIIATQIPDTHAWPHPNHFAPSLAAKLQ
jgi:hypothetical protein